MTENTLRLLYDLLCRQQLNVGASRDDIGAVLTARQELEDALAALEKATADS